MVTVGPSVECVCLEPLTRLPKQALMFDSGVVCTEGKHDHLSSTHSGPGTVFSATGLSVTWFLEQRLPGGIDMSAFSLSASPLEALHASSAKPVPSSLPFHSVLTALL